MQAEQGAEDDSHLDPKAYRNAGNHTRIVKPQGLFPVTYLLPQGHST